MLSWAGWYGDKTLPSEDQTGRSLCTGFKREVYISMPHCEGKGKLGEGPHELEERGHGGGETRGRTHVVVDNSAALGRGTERDGS